MESCHEPISKAGGDRSTHSDTHVIRVPHRIGHVVLSMALGSLGQGCFFESPLDPDASVRVDPAILGTWRCLGFDAEADSQPANFVVSRANDHRYAITVQQQGEVPGEYEAYASLIKGQAILNVRLPKATDPPKQWALARYSFLRTDVMQVQLVDDSKLKSVDSSSATLRRAFQKVYNQADLFWDYCVCVRVKP